MHIRRAVANEEILDLSLIRCSWRTLDYEGDGDLTLDRVGHGHDSDVDEVGMFQQNVLNFLGINAFAGTTDAVIDAANDLDITVLIRPNDIARAEPPVGQQSFRRDL